MTRNQVISTNIRDPRTAENLQLHVEERSSILQSFANFAEGNGAVRAAWLWGSFQRGEQDDLSDLDIWLLVEDSNVATFGNNYIDLVERLLDLHGGDNNRK